MSAVLDADWNAVSAGWARLADRIEEMHADVTEPMVAAAAPLAGQRVLELGSGPGVLATRLAAAVGPEGSVVASDVAEGMVAALRERLAEHVDERGAARVTAQRVDAQQVPYDDGSFDVVVFRMGLMHVPETGRALEEIHRVLRTGGRFVAAVWGDMGHNPWLTSVGMSAMMTGLVSGPPVGPGGPFSLGDHEALEQRVRSAGFDPVEVRVVDAVRRYSSVDDLMDMGFTLAPPLAKAYASATPQQQHTLRGKVDEVTASYRHGDALELPSRALVVVARRP